LDELETQLRNPGWEINTYPNKTGRMVKLSQMAAKEVMAYIFPGLPEPGKAKHNDLEKSIIELMDNKGKDQRQKQHTFNLMCELAHKTEKNWFVVFNTLTVRQGHYYKVFSKDSKEFKNYVRQFEREVNEATTGTRNVKGEPNHYYFACVEEGGEGGRLHIHIVHICRKLPNQCYDPNRGKPTPIYREIPRLKRLWNHGFSTPIAARFSPLDAYGKEGWRWPIDARTDDALVINPPAKLANYMSKYIKKGYTCKKRAKLLWRVRKSHNLGRDLLDELTSQLSTNSLLLLASDATITLKLNNSPIPPNMQRMSALRTLQSRIQNQSECPDLEEIAKQLLPLPSLLHNLRNSTHTTETSKRQNTTLILTWITENGGLYEQCRQDIEHARRVIDTKYFRRSHHAPGKTATTDYIHPKSSLTEHTYRSQN